MQILRFGITAACVVAVLACNSLVGVDFNDARLEEQAAGSGDAAAAGTTPTGERTGVLCTPKTCGQLSKMCGVHDDGCGNALDCSACPGGGECQSGQCRCSRTTCPGAGASCGTAPDGCGNVLDCGSCAVAGDVCTSGACGCAPTTCAALGVGCGRMPDGCGGTLECGGCDGGLNCNGGQCTAAPCGVVDCAAQGKNCGSASNGCGSLIDCGSCAGTAVCGGSGAAGVCGCTPLTCAQIGASCGGQPNGCGGTIDCGGCGPGTTCGGAGDPKTCGCTPNPNACAGKNCGVVDNGCGTSVACGTCAAPNNTCSGNLCSCVYTGCSAGCGPGVDNCGNACNLGACGCVSTTCQRTCLDNCGEPCDYGLCGTPTCFAGGTQIRLADGSTRAIENVAVGDLIATYDPNTGETHAARVTKALVHAPEADVDGLVLVNGRLRVTPNHPLLVNGKRVLAGELKAGDSLLAPRDLSALRMQSVSNNSLRAIAATQIERLPVHVQTYDLQTEDGAGFFADDIVVLIKQQP